MSWAPGDLALCVTTEAWSNLVDNTVSSGPGCGAVVEVAKITTFRDLLMLCFVEWPNDYFDASAFRKLEPLTKHERMQEQAHIDVCRNLARVRARDLVK